MKKYVSLLLFFALVFCIGTTAFAHNGTYNGAVSELTQPFEIDSTSAVLIESTTGTVLYSKNSDKKLAPASVTKIMTLLLVAEGLKDGKIALDDTVTISKHAASMGGSQVFLEEGETMSVRDLLKSTVIASANDAAVALAEYLCGSEANFVNEMNKRAKELKMENTTFENVTGLDDTTTNHLTSAMDIATMSRELIKHSIITDFSSLWQDSIRDGEFTLTNTNRLVRYYDGCNGLKTGSTAKAGYCVSVSAKRDGVELIAVIMDAPDRDVRNNIARTLLDYGFANYTLYSYKESMIESVPLYSGELDKVDVYAKDFSIVLNKGDLKNVNVEYQIPEYIMAPLKSGDVVGKVVFKLNDNIIGESELFVKENVGELTFLNLVMKILRGIVGLR